MKDVTLSNRLLRHPAQHAARLVARSRLELAFERVAPFVVGEGEALDAATPSEAVHDFRVALRRLRTWLRACRDAVDDTVPRRRMRQLRELSRDAGKARDIEVQMTWLGTIASSRNRPAARTAAWLMKQDAIAHREAVRQLHDALAERWSAIGTRLGRELQHYKFVVDLDDPESTTSMGEFLAAALRRQAKEMHEMLDPPPSMRDVRAIHLVRIAAKRLRYLLEVIDPRVRAGGAALDAFTEVQQELGELHDAQMLTARIADLPPAKRGAPGRAAITALHAASRRRVTRATRAGRQAIEAARTEAVLAGIEALAQRCERSQAG